MKELILGGIRSGKSRLACALHNGMATFTEAAVSERLAIIAALISTRIA